MKHFILSGLILALFFTALFISCNNEGQSNFSTDVLKTSEILKENGSIHNSGLDYIKNNALKTNNKCTQQYIGEVLGEYVRSIYDKEEAQKIMQEIEPVQKLVFKEHVATLRQTRSSSSINIAIAATKECMDKIKHHLASFSNDEVFDNKKILDDLHLLISQTYEEYVNKCNSDLEKQALVQSLGVLYGSIEYWTNSENVVFWSKYKMEENGGLSSGYVPNTRGKEKNEGKEKDKKLSRKEYIEVVAAADVVGSFLGAAVASGPAAIAASAAAALYFDVED